MFAENIFVCLCIICVVQGGRVLVVVPSPSISHQVAFRPLTQELAKRGHEVIVITADPAFPKGQAPENLTEIDVHDLSYHMLRSSSFDKSARGSTQNSAKTSEIIQRLMGELFEKQIMTPEIQNLIRNSTKFDLVMAEAWVRPPKVLSHVLQAPLILVSSFGCYGNYMYDLTGAPTRPVLLYPSIFTHKLFNLTLWDKIETLYRHYYMETILRKQEEIDDRRLRRLFGPDTPSIQELENRVDMIFLNIHAIWDFNRPVPPNIIYMGGIHQMPSKELPTDLKSYLDSSKHGVIYISFGTNVDPTLLPSEKIQTLVKTFSRLPYDVLWKWNNDELPGRSNNIRISKWLPQSDLLKHPKVKLFITQGGLQSTDEAITAGVPLIGMPMLGDQWYTVEQYVYRGIGLRVDMETLTEEQLSTAIDTIINDDSYRANVVKLRGIMRDQPQPPLDRAVWWAEHVMRHGGAPHLRARVANMTWREYLDAELLTFIAGSLLTALMITAYAASLIIRLLKSIFSSSRKLKIK